MLLSEADHAMKSRLLCLQSSSIVSAMLQIQCFTCSKEVITTLRSCHCLLFSILANTFKPIHRTLGAGVVCWLENVPACTFHCSHEYTVFASSSLEACFEQPWPPSMLDHPTKTSFLGSYWYSQDFQTWDLQDPLSLCFIFFLQLDYAALKPSA